MRNFAVRHDAVAFHVLAYLLFWAATIPLAVSGRSMDQAPLLAGLLGAYAPTLAGLIMAGLTEGRAGIGRLLARLVQWRVQPYLYLFALLAPAAVAGVAVLVHALPGMGPAASLQVEMPGQVAGLSPWVLAPILFLVNVFLGGALCEELGWRGFMLPRLQERYGPARASLVLGVTWGLWHLPLFFIAGTVQSRIPFLLFLLSTCASSFLFTWVSDRGRGSVLLAVLLHAAINTTASVAPVAPHDWTLLALTWGLVGVLYLAPARRVVT